MSATLSENLPEGDKPVDGESETVTKPEFDPQQFPETCMGRFERMLHDPEFHSIETEFRAQIDAQMRRGEGYRCMPHF